MPSTIQQPSDSQKFQKSIGGSLQSLFNPGKRTYFIIEYKTNSEKHRVGESSNFISDYVEIGRGDKYAINFGDDCGTVSRPHAAILRKDSGWMLTPISATNATIVNGRAISGDTLLRNGDEIQLSSVGPKFSFLVSSNPSIKNLGFTIRMKSALNEAIRPYKTLIATLSLVFIAAIAGLSFYFHSRISESDKIINNLLSRKPHTDTLIQRDTVVIKLPVVKDHSSSGSGNGQLLTSLYPNTYYLQSYKLVITYNQEEYVFPYKISGTGFLLNNGKFITARHMVEPWLFNSDPSDSAAILANILSTKGAKIKFYFIAYSPDGAKVEMANDDFAIDASYDKQTEAEIWGNKSIFTVPTANGADWASADFSRSGGLAFDKAASTSLQASTPLIILGYPWGKGANSEVDIQPLYSECKVSRGGLDNGVIDAGNIGIDHGNSGGPVFMKNDNGSFIVVGIVSAEQGKQGFLIPINAIQ